MPKHQIYAELFTQYTWLDELFNAEGDKESANEFEEFRIEAKFEVGTWDDRLNLLLAVPMETAQAEDGEGDERTTGLEEVKLGAKYRFNEVSARMPYLIGAQAVAKFALCEDDAQPPLADCQTDWELVFLWSAGFPTGVPVSRLFTSLEAGYRLREERPADEILYVFEVGGELVPRIWLKGRLEGVESKPWGSGLEEDFAKWAVSVFFAEDPVQRADGVGDEPSTRLTLEVGFAQVFDGRNTGALDQVFFKIAYQFDLPTLLSRS